MNFCVDIYRPPGNIGTIPIHALLYLPKSLVHLKNMTKRKPSAEISRCGWLGNILSAYGHLYGNVFPERFKIVKIVSPLQRRWRKAPEYAQILDTHIPFP